MAIARHRNHVCCVIALDARKKLSVFCEESSSMKMQQSPPSSEVNDNPSNGLRTGQKDTSEVFLIQLCSQCQEWRQNNQGEWEPSQSTLLLKKLEIEDMSNSLRQ